MVLHGAAATFNRVKRERQRFLLLQKPRKIFRKKTVEIDLQNRIKSRNNLSDILRDGNERLLLLHANKPIDQSIDRSNARAMNTHLLIQAINQSIDVSLEDAQSINQSIDRSTHQEMIDESVINQSINRLKEEDNTKST